jgi:predicted transcriptional regulator
MKLPEDVKKALKDTADAMGKTPNEIVEQLVRERLMTK